MKNENKYQPELIKHLNETIPGCCPVLKNDGSNTPQGFPDITVVHRGKTAYLEAKRSAKEKHQPNQDHYIRTLNEEGFYASFIFPENEKEVLNELYTYLGVQKCDCMEGLQ